MRLGAWMRVVTLGLAGLFVVTGATHAGIAAQTGAGEGAQPTPASAEPMVQLSDRPAVPGEAVEHLMRTPEGAALVRELRRSPVRHDLLEGVPQLAVIFAALLLFAFGCMVYADRQNARLHHTIRQMVEKGVPIPTELLHPTRGSERGASPGVADSDAQALSWMRSDLFWGGLLWIGVGVGALLFFWWRENVVWWLGIIPILYGVGAVIAAAGGRPPARRPVDVLWGGLLWVGVGVGALLFFWWQGSTIWPLGLIPVVYGLAAIVVSFVARPRNGPSSSGRSDG